MSNVIRWNPFREIAEMQRQFDRAFDEGWQNTESHTEVSRMPIDVTETDDNYTVVADLPGLTSDEIDVNFHDGVLTINGEIHQQTVDENNRVLVRERTYGKFKRRIKLPTPIDVDNISATYNDGVLTLDLSKVERAKPRQIQIKQQKQ
jgi:HSP20 family protein